METMCAQVGTSDVGMVSVQRAANVFYASVIGCGDSMSAKNTTLHFLDFNFDYTCGWIVV